MSFKLPWWFWLASMLAVAGGLVGLGYWLGTRGGSEKIEAIRERAAQDSAAFDSVRAVLDDSLVALEGAVTEIGERVDTVRIRIPVAVRHAEAAGENLEEHLRARGDTAGLRLSREEEAADSAVLALRVHESDLLSEQLGLVRDELRIQRRIIGEQDSLIFRLRSDLAEALAEADRLHRKANPPFTIKLLRGLPEFAAGVGGGYLLAKL